MNVASLPKHFTIDETVNKDSLILTENTYNQPISSRLLEIASMVMAVANPNDPRATSTPKRQNSSDQTDVHNHLNKKNCMNEGKQ